MVGMVDDSEVLKRIENERFELPLWQGRVRARREAICIHPTFVWRPCLESLSPFYPIRMVTVGDHRLYIRVDGPVFTSLTLGVHGI